MPPSKAKPSTYQLKITLLEIEPPIWRRIQVPSTMRLCSLHDAIQAVFGWTDTHLHHFEKHGEYWGVPDDEFEDRGDESKVSVGKVMMGEGDWMIYTYDFGDNWRHRILLERIVRAETPSSRPICLDGRRRRPPEDIGGPSGYKEFLNVSFEPGHEEFSHVFGWAGGEFHAEEFDLKAVNRILERMRWPIRHRRASPPSV